MPSSGGLYDPGVKIDLLEVGRIAKLAQLELDETESAVLADQLSSILTHMESLATVDTSDIEPTFNPVEHATPLRDDVPRPGQEPGARTEEALEESAKQFLVPRII